MLIQFRVKLLGGSAHTHTHTLSHLTGNTGHAAGQLGKKKQSEILKCDFKDKKITSQVIKTQGVFQKLCVLQVIWILFTFTN